MKRDCLLITLLILAITLTACGNGGYTGSLDPRKIHTGTEGLRMTFLKNAPPDVVMEGDTFRVIAQLDNRGAHDISEGWLKLLVETDYFNTAKETQVDLKIKGKSVINPAGESTTATFNITAKKIPETMSLYHDSEFVLTGCYKYKTYVEKNVCIDPDIYNLNLAGVQKVCTMGKLSMGSQGGPVEVSSIEPKFTEVNEKINPGFAIYVRNAGTGMVVEEGSTANACDRTGPSREQWNVVYVNAWLGDKPMDCNPKSESTKKAFVRLRGSGDYVTCSISESLEQGMAPYYSVLRIELSYGYTTSVSKIVRVKRV